MKLSDFNYNLPKELIAQYPLKKRDESRLLVLNRSTGEIQHRIFKDITEYFHKDDLLVLNNTKVVPAKLVGRKETGGKVEVLVLRSSTRKGASAEYEVLLKPTRGCGVGSRLIFGNGRLEAHVTRIENGRRFLMFECNGNFGKMLDRFGQMPLPPYIRRNSETTDINTYQTIYADKLGAVAAPTAGLHFTKNVLSGISEKGIDIEYVTLHVGYGTFKPVKSEDITEHKMEKEYFELDKKVLKKIETKKGRTIAVGTTTCRVLEALSKPGLDRGIVAGGRFSWGWTDLFIYPGYNFKRIDALLTNFHLPMTTLFMLVSAFCGTKLLHRVYKEAIDRKYRFYSYGDSMLIV